MSAEFERYVVALAAWSGVEARVRRGTQNLDAARDRGLQASTEGTKQVHARVQRLEKAIGRNVDDVRNAFAGANASALLAGLVTPALDAQSEVTEARLQSAFTEHRAAAEEAVAAARRTASSRPSTPVRPDAARSAGRLVVVGIVTLVVAVTIVAILIGFNT